MSFVAARDPIGIRPLYYGYTGSGKILFASEPKNLVGLAGEIMPFPPGHYYADGKFVCYNDIAARQTPCGDDLETVCTKIREKLAMGVAKRLDADVPVGFLLSGGLDSSLVCAIATKLLNCPIRTFAIGMETDAIDLKYAKQVADFIGSEHTEIIITREDVISSLETVVSVLGTYDITTIRASMGMYLICKAIHEQTDVRVLLTGEISDELSLLITTSPRHAEAFQKRQKRCASVCMTFARDRCILRKLPRGPVPFGDLNSCSCHVHTGEMKMNSYQWAISSAPRLRGRQYCRASLARKAALLRPVGHSLVTI